MQSGAWFHSSDTFAYVQRHDRRPVPQKQRCAGERRNRPGVGRKDPGFGDDPQAAVCVGLGECQPALFVEDNQLPVGSDKA